MHCLACEREVELLTKAQAAELLDVGAPVLDLFISAGQVHAIKTISGNLRICKDSLFAGNRPVGV